MSCAVFGLILTWAMQLPPAPVPPAASLTTNAGSWYNAPSAALPNPKPLIFYQVAHGGRTRGGRVLDDTFLFDSRACTSATFIAPPSVARSASCDPGHRVGGVMLHKNNDVILWGGDVLSNSQAASDFFYLDLRTQLWRSQPPPPPFNPCSSGQILTPPHLWHPAARHSPSVVCMKPSAGGGGGGVYLVFGGFRSDGSACADAWLLNTDADQVQPPATSALSRRFCANRVAG